MSEDPFAIVLAFAGEDRERFVLARHAERGWEIPGGHLEPGETPLEAARREFAEEIGHALDSLEPVLVQQREVGTCHVFAGRVGEPMKTGQTRDDMIEEWRFVEQLSDVEPLAFPEDPYEQIEDELGVDLGAPQ